MKNFNCTRSSYFLKTDPFQPGINPHSKSICAFVIPHWGDSGQRSSEEAEAPMKTRPVVTSYLPQPTQTHFTVFMYFSDFIVFVHKKQKVLLPAGNPQNLGRKRIFRMKHLYNHMTSGWIVGVWTSVRLVQEARITNDLSLNQRCEGWRQILMSMVLLHLTLLVSSFQHNSLKKSKLSPLSEIKTSFYLYLRCFWSKSVTVKLKV